MEKYTFSEIEEAHRPRLQHFIREFWGGDVMVSRGQAHYPARQEGFRAAKDGVLVGIITYTVQNGEMEVTLLDSREREQGVGSRLIELAVERARHLGCSRVWMITTNDNIRAFRFYQKRGFNLAALHRNALEESRKLKPGIPATGQEGIPIRHELEFELRLG